MKFRALSGLDMVVSEIGYAVGTPSIVDSLQAARLARLAYDEGVNLFLLPAGSVHDGVLAHAFSGPVRSRVCLVASIQWPGAAAFERLRAAVEFRLAGLSTDRLDLLLLRDVPAERLIDGSAADVIHRLRTAGKVRAGGLAESAGAPISARDLFRASASVVEFTPVSTNGFTPGFDPSTGGEDVSAIARLTPPSVAAAGDLAFLWNGTGRTRVQSVISLALSSPWVSSVLIGAATDEELRDAARAPLAPALTAPELSAARIDRRPVLAGA